jgi:hypothetical protein
MLARHWFWVVRFSGCKVLTMVAYVSTNVILSSTNLAIVTMGCHFPLCMACKKIGAIYKPDVLQ